MPVEVGTQAPDFSLPNVDRETVSLADFRGKKAVLLVFYPFAFSGVCTGEFTQAQADAQSFNNDTVELVAVSTDPVPALKAWVDQQGYEFQLLSDFWPHGATAESYGVFFTDGGFALRGTFLIDRDGVIRFAEANGPGEARDQEAWKEAVKNLGS